MEYKNEICPVCGKIFSDGDDIVVCPECGTPHHRECWAVNNRCANEVLHGEGFEWKKSNAEVPPSGEPVIQSTDNNGADENTNAPFSIPVMESSDFGEDNFEALCMRGVNAGKDEQFDGMRIGDIAFYIQQNARNYINKFIKGKKLSFNWAALLFSPAWFFYRKLYKAGAVFLALTVAVSLFTYPLTKNLEAEEIEIYEMMGIDSGSESMTREDIKELLESKNAEKYTARILDYSKKAAVLATARVLPQLIAALCANELYKRKIKKDLSAVNSAAEDKNTKRMLIAQRGGVSFLIGAVVFIAADYIVPMLLSAGNFFMDLF